MYAYKENKNKLLNRIRIPSPGASKMVQWAKVLVAKA